MRKFIEKKLSIIIPTYNEGKNIHNLIEDISKKLNQINFEIIIVDDGSSDETAEVILKNFENSKNVKIIQREHDKGLLQSIKFALQTISGEYFLVMDGDGQHSPEDIVHLLKELENNDLVIGIRDLDNITSISKNRAFLSKLFNKMVSLILKKKLSDPLTGFFVGKITLLNKKFFLLNNSGFKILLDLIFCNKDPNIKITEKKINFRKRDEGVSKLNSQVTFSFFTQIISYLFNGLISSKFIGFALIGAFGFIIHFIILFICLNNISLSFYTSHILATLITASFNYVFNNYLNFYENEIKDLNSFVRGLFKYYLINIPGILSSISGASFAYNVLNKNPFFSSFIGVMLDTVFKYIISRTWIWKSR
tara:strand:+ start:1214 stop:2308 length:1095 start_codon:yes stop_codon:yes gene_type:complete